MCDSTWDRESGYIESCATVLVTDSPGYIESCATVFGTDSHGYIESCVTVLGTDSLVYFEKEHFDSVHTSKLSVLGMYSS